MSFKKLIARALGSPFPPSHAAELAEALVAEPPESIVAEPPEIVTLHSMSTDRALWRLAGRALEMGTVIDIGASDGRWSAVCETYYPASCYLLVEVQEPHEEGLKAYSAHCT